MKRKKTEHTAKGLSMGEVEQRAHDLLKDRPKWKNRIKWVYQSFLSLFSGSPVKSDVKMVKRTNAFFGFHDKTPWSSDGEYLLGHTFNNAGGCGDCDAYKQGRRVQISVFSGEEWTEKQRITSTRAWNWQQGAQLQWVGDKNEFVYNDFKKGACVAVRHNVEGEEEQIEKYPVAAVSPNGCRFASICFDALGRAMNGYGYAFGATQAYSPVAAAELIVGSFEDDGVLQLHVSDLDTKLDVEKSGGGLDFFSHCLFSPDNKRLLFLRRQARSGQRLRSEMFCVHLDRHTVIRLPFHNMVSHFTWLGEKRVLAYGNTKDGGDSFYCVNLETNTIDNCGQMLGRRDGHPSATRSGDLVVYDTYPDGRRYQRLYLWDAESRERTLLARVYAPMKFWGECRLDLHPRIRGDGCYISFDVGYDGVRSLVTARLVGGYGRD